MTEEIKARIESIRKGEVPNGYSEGIAGILPNDWTSKPLSEISEVISERAGDDDYETLSISAGIGFVNQAQKFGKELSGKQYEKYTVLRKGDFAYNKGNSKRYPQGCTYRLKERDEAAVPNVFECFRITEGCPEYYEQLFINGFMNRQLMRKINHGVRDDGLLNLTDADFYSTVLPIPPLAEQKKIAEVLSACDSVIELKQQLLDEKCKQKQWLMQMLLNPDSGVRLPGFEGSAWICKKAKELCSISTGQSNTQDKQADGIYPFYIRSDIPVKSNRYLYDCEAVITIGDGNIGKVFHYVNGKFDLHQRCYKMTDFNGVLGKYFFYYFSENFYNRVIKMSAKATVDSVRLEMIADMDIWLPAKKEEQAKIAEILTNMDKQIELYCQALEEWQHKKKALMQLLLTGLVRTKN